MPRKKPSSSSSENNAPNPTPERKSKRKRIPKKTFDPSDIEEQQIITKKDDNLMQEENVEEENESEEEKQKEVENVEVGNKEIDWTDKLSLQKLEIIDLRKELQRRGINDMGNRRQLVSKIINSNNLEDLMNLKAKEEQRKNAKRNAKKKRKKKENVLEEVNEEVNEEKLEEQIIQNKEVKEEEKQLEPISSNIQPTESKYMEVDEQVEESKTTTPTVDDTFNLTSTDYIPSKRSQSRRPKEFNSEDPTTWTLSELRKYLRVLGLSVVGNKKQLLKKYLEYMEKKKDDNAQINNQLKSSTDENKSSLINYENEQQKVSEIEENESDKEKKLTLTTSTEEKDKKKPAYLEYSFMPSYAFPWVHYSLEDGYKKKFVKFVDVTAIHPEDSKLTSSYHYLHNEYPLRKSIQECDDNDIPLKQDSILKKILDKHVKKLSLSIEELVCLDCNCKEKKEIISSLSGLESCKKLSKLIAEGNHISFLKPIMDLSELIELYLSRNEITEMKYLPNKCKYIDLSFNCINLLNFPSSICAHVTYLNLSYNKMKINLEPLCEMNCLKELDITGNDLTNDMLVCLHNAKFNTTLHSLRMNDNYITDLSFLMSFEYLFEFSANSNFILDISPISCLRRISEIDLQDNPPLILSIHLNTKNISNDEISNELINYYKYYGDLNLKVLSMLKQIDISIVI
ncbi:hypothetical protein ABK040_010257 [Willaertia magna]